MIYSNWYILIVQQGYELTIKQKIEETSIEYPVEEVEVTVDMPGYVFIRSVYMCQQSVRKFLSLDGSIKFLGLKKNNVFIPKKFSNREISKLSVHQQTVTVKKVFCVGDYIIIKRGDLADIQGQIIEIKKRIVKIKPTIFHKIVRTRIQDIESI